MSPLEFEIAKVDCITHTIFIACAIRIQRSKCYSLDAKLNRVRD